MKDSLDKIRWLVVALLLSTLPAMAEVRDTLTFDISDLSSETIVGNNETFMRLSFPDCDHLDMVGAPMLPVKYIRLSVPYNATDVSVTATSTSSATIIPRRIYPAQMPLTTNDEPDTISFVMDSVIYSSNTYWPSNVAELVGDGFYLGENRIVTVAVYPLQYRPNNKMLRKNTQVRLVVQYSLGGTPTNMLVRRGGDLRLQEQESAKTIVRNPEQVHGFAMTEAQIQHMPPVGLLPDSLLTDTAGYGYGGELQQAWGDRARYLIVTTRELAPSFKRLAALKRQKGYSVQIKCIEDILADPRVQQGDIFRDSNGNIISTINDDAGKLRQYLKLARAFDNTQFVLLGGKNVPYRYGWHSKKFGDAGNIDIPTDQYYVDLTSNWNPYNNSSEPYGLSHYRYDLLPELYVGRLLGDSAQWIENYIDKLMRYELNPGNGNTTYLRRSLSFEKQGSIGYSDSIMSNLGAIFIQKDLICERTIPPYNTGKDFIDQINSIGYGFVDIFAHASPNGIVVCNKSGHKSAIKALSQQTIVPNPSIWKNSGGLDSLYNKLFPFIMYTSCCNSMPYDTYVSDNGFSYDVLMNVGESFTLGKSYGGVAYIGNTRFGGTVEMPKLGAKFAKQISNGCYSLGAAVANSKCDYGDKYHSMVNNLLGDPEFEMWTDEPSLFTNVMIQRTDNSINLTGLGDDIVYVGVSDGERSSSIGNVTINNISPNSTVMVYQHNYLPYIAPLYLQNERIERSQYVIANDVYAGRAVDANRTTGDLTIAAGNEYEIETKGKVVLAPGFIVEKGALFSVSQSDY